jgi:hypothetical protein
VPAPDPPDREAIAASLALLVAPDAAPAAPEDQLGRALLELRVVRGRLEAIGPSLPPRLGAPASRLARALGRELSRAFPELERV